MYLNIYTPNYLSIYLPSYIPRDPAYSDDAYRCHMPRLRLPPLPEPAPGPGQDVPAAET